MPHDPNSIDHVTGKSKPVTKFTQNAAVDNANKKADRDKDGVARVAQ